jgi:hypothetical protein
MAIIDIDRSYTASSQFNAEGRERDNVSEIWDTMYVRL